MGKAQEAGRVKFIVTQMRDFAEDKHRKVDDTPYGGGAGMLLRPDVLHRAWEFASGGSKRPGLWTVLLSPQGGLFDQNLARNWLSGTESIAPGGPAQLDTLILVCGHYEGVDERFIDLCVDQEVSIGNYVLTGGELPALVIADVVTRLLPGVVGNPDSISTDSLENGLLKYPQYTKPREFMGLSVPDVLLSGDHRKISDWRHEESVKRTQLKRPDLAASKK